MRAVWWIVLSHLFMLNYISQSPPSLYVSLLVGQKLIWAKFAKTEAKQQQPGSEETGKPPWRSSWLGVMACKHRSTVLILSLLYPIPWPALLSDCQSRWKTAASGYPDVIVSYSPLHQLHFMVLLWQLVMAVFPDWPASCIMSTCTSVSGGQVSDFTINLQILLLNSPAFSYSWVRSITIILILLFASLVELW